MRAAERLGVLLREVGIGLERHYALIGLPPGGVPPAEVLMVLDRPEDARLARLHEIFLNGETVSRVRAAQAVDPVPLGDLIEAGLLETVGDDVRAMVRMATIGGVILAGDVPSAWGDENFVTSLSVPGRTVAYATVRRDVGTALDVGTGSGIQALLAAQHAERVVGTDVNPHALWLAELGQQLTGIDNTTWIEGAWFEPARGERFDLVVVNPPVTISPDHALLARDSAMGGEDLSRQMVRDAADHLADGGFATVLCNWSHRAGGWEMAPRDWVAGVGCDAVVINVASQDALAYAMGNLLDHPGQDPAQTAESIKRWTDHYRQTGVELIAIGLVVLRRRTAGTPWVQAFQASGAPSGWGGDQLERMFAGGDFLASRSGAEVFRDLLATPWRLVDHRLDQRLVHENGAYATGGALLVHEPGLGVSAPVDPRIVPLIVGCDGRRPLAAVLGATPVPVGLEKGAFQQLCLSTIRDLIVRGYLVGDGWPGEEPGRQGAAREARA
jgi:SAM-dependent methyltransferase